MKDTDFEYVISSAKDSETASNGEKIPSTEENSQAVDLETLEIALTFLEVSADAPHYEMGTGGQDGDIS